MTVEEAREAMAYHSGRHEEIDSPRWERGFSGSLRPFTGRLNREAMREVVHCLRVLTPTLQSGRSIERELLTDFMQVVATAQCWALAPDGMLRRNNLINSEEIDLLSNWVGEFSMALALIVEGVDYTHELEQMEANY